VGEKILSPKVIHKVPEKAELKSNNQFKVFSCQVLALSESKHLKKFDSRTVETIFLSPCWKECRRRRSLGRSVRIVRKNFRDKTRIDPLTGRIMKGRTSHFTSSTFGGSKLAPVGVVYWRLD